MAARIAAGPRAVVPTEVAMGGFIKQVFATLFALLLFFFGGVFLLLIVASSGKKTVIPSGSTLHLVLPISLPDYPGGNAQPFGDPPPTFHDLRLALRKAAVDERIDRVVLQMGITEAGWSKLGELRQEVAAVRKAGKPVFAYVDWLTYRNYYLAAACDSVWIAPDAFVVFDGINAERQFHKSLWDKLGVRFRVHKIEKYKAAGEIDVRTDMSPEARENAQWILDETTSLVRTQVSADRKRDVAWFDSLLTVVAPRAHEAKQLGMVDDVVYWNDLEDRWQGADAEKNKNKSRIVTFAKYAKIPPSSVGMRGPTKVAVIHAQGAIGGAKSGENPLLGGYVMGYESVNAEIRKVARDKSIDAVVLRVDSPGGSTFASDLIRHQVEMLERAKPLVVSMGDAAASGGYMISYPCSMIVANELTRTGSIGSIFQLPNFSGLAEKVGLTTDRVTYGPHATIGSVMTNWTAEEESLVARQHWKSYNEWVEDIARVRGTTFAGIDSIGRGRVWTGRQAIGLNLVDSLGTLSDAIRIAAAMSGAKADDKVSESHYPRQQTFIEALQAGDLVMARRILALAIWHEAKDSVQEMIDSATALTRGEIAIDPMADLP
ncbi:MAG: signal peptide peptidase SppA [Myxococcales bacterium]|nr:signal peptide peptidase SppA [Myxococcales bacterium]